MSKQMLIEALNDLMKHVSTSAGHTALHDLIIEIEDCGLQGVPSKPERYDDLRRSA